MARSKRGKDCTIQLHADKWTVWFRDPRRGGKPVRRSLMTSDKKMALRYKGHLDRLISDASLWEHPPKDIPPRIREIWLADLADVTVEVDGEQIKVAPYPGRRREVQVIREHIGVWAISISRYRPRRNYRIQECRG